MTPGGHNGRELAVQAAVQRSLHRGFTLIEVLVVVTVVAVLAGVAMPHYVTHVQRSHRVHAQAALLQAAQWLERAATVQGIYPARAAIPAGVLAVEGNRYTLEFSALNANAYLLQATPTASQGTDPCGIFGLNEAGVRTQVATLLVPVPLSAQACWSR